MIEMLRQMEVLQHQVRFVLYIISQSDKNEHTTFQVDISDRSQRSCFDDGGEKGGSQEHPGI